MSLAYHVKGFHGYQLESRNASPEDPRGGGETGDASSKC